ncbi:hypothetical protein CAXC1_220019 [Candidatus Xenohaliotis californiensis]|uniref:Porin domain-containing protein n=1 Tax=Candidatus Xenohaliotis californiensis TaxID=84677 RepID=A0ABP0EV59_9RICK|nr:hypothetical protein CAXC1_220019 [Candidatus Xenohaliotis californiensis]
MTDLCIQSQIMQRDIQDGSDNIVKKTASYNVVDTRSSFKLLTLSTFLISSLFTSTAFISTNANASHHHDNDKHHDSNMHHDNKHNHDNMHHEDKHHDNKHHHEDKHHDNKHHHEDKHHDNKHHHEDKHHGKHRENKHKTEMKQHTKHNNMQYHAPPTKYEPTSVYHRGTKTSLYGDVDFHFAFLDNEDKFKLGRLTRDHVMSTTYSVGGEAEIWVNKDTRVGAIVGLAATKDKRYVFDVVGSSDPVLSSQNTPVSLPALQSAKQLNAKPTTSGKKPTVGTSSTNLNFDVEVGTAKVLDLAGSSTTQIAAKAGTGGIDATVSGVVNSATPVIDKVAIKLPEVTLSKSGTESVNFTSTGYDKLLTPTGGGTVDSVKASNKAVTVASGDTATAIDGSGITLTLNGTGSVDVLKKTGLSATKVVTATGALTTTDVAGITDPATITATAAAPLTTPKTTLAASSVPAINTQDFSGSGSDTLTHKHAINSSDIAGALTATTTIDVPTISVGGDTALKLKSPDLDGDTKLVQNKGLSVDDLAVDLSSITLGTPSLADADTRLITAKGGSGAPTVDLSEFVDPTKLAFAPALTATVEGYTAGYGSTGTADIEGDLTANIAAGADVPLAIPTKDIPVIASIAGNVLPPGTVPITIPITGSVTASGVVDGLSSTLNNYARFGDAKATFVDAHLDRAAVYIESKFGRFEAGLDEGPEVKLRTDASTIAHGTGGIDGVWHYYANLGGVVGPNLLNTTYNTFFPDINTSDFGLTSSSYFFYQPATFSEFNLENAPKVAFYSPDFGGFRIGMSYSAEQSDDNVYQRFANKNGQSYSDVLSGAAEYSFMMNDMEFTASVFGEFAEHNERCLSNLTSSSNSERCVQNYYDLKNLGFGGSFGFHGIRFAGSYVNLKKSGQRMDLAWNPDWHVSNAKNNPTGGTVALAPTVISNNESALYSKSERPETKRGIPNKVLFKDFALVQVNFSETSKTQVFTGGTGAAAALSEDATAGITLDVNGNIIMGNALFPFAVHTAAADTEISLKVTPADTDDDVYGEHDSYYWTLGAAYEMGPVGFSITYMNAKTQQNDAWGGRTRLRNFVASFDYEIAKGFTPYIEVSYFKTEDKTYGFLDAAQLQTTAATAANPSDVTGAMVNYDALQDTLFAQMYGNSIYMYSSDAGKGADINEIKKLVEDENKGYTVMIGAKMSF